MKALVMCGKIKLYELTAQNIFYYFMSSLKTIDGYRLLVGGHECSTRSSTSAADGSVGLFLHHLVVKARRMGAMPLRRWTGVLRWVSRASRVSA